MEVRHQMNKVRRQLERKYFTTHRRDIQQQKYVGYY